MKKDWDKVHLSKPVVNFFLTVVNIQLFLCESKITIYYWAEIIPHVSLHHYLTIYEINSVPAQTEKMVKIHDKKYIMGLEE